MFSYNTLIKHTKERNTLFVEHILTVSDGCGVNAPMCLLLVFAFDCDALFVFKCQILCVSLFCHFAYVKCFHVSALSWLVIVPHLLFCFGSLLSSCVDFL